MKCQEVGILYLLGLIHDLFDFNSSLSSIAGQLITLNQMLELHFATIDRIVLMYELIHNIAALAHHNFAFIIKINDMT